jgi:hypothetical protein
MKYFVHIWIPIPGLLVSAGTLAVVVKYTAITARLGRAAQDQIEASRKPVVVLLFDIRSDDFSLIFESPNAQRVPPATMLRISESGNFLISNIGTGPALNVTVSFGPVPEHSAANRYARKIQFIVPGSRAETPIGLGNNLGDEYTFTARYESLSGRKYFTELQLQVREPRVVVPKDNWIFKEVDSKA